VIILSFTISTAKDGTDNNPTVRNMLYHILYDYNMLYCNQAVVLFTSSSRVRPLPFHQSVMVTQVAIIWLHEPR